MRAPGRRAVAALVLLALTVPGATSPAAAAEPTPGTRPPSTSPTGPTTEPAPAPTAAPGADAPPGPGTCASSSEEAPVAVEVTTLTPRAPTTATEPFQVTGRLTNCGREPAARLEVRLVVGGRLTSRSALAQATDEPVLGTRRLPAAAAAQELLAPGASTTFALRLQVGDLGLGRENGVFPVAVQARAEYGRASGRGSVGLASTFVPWFPDGPIAPTRIAWLLPLVDVPHRGPDGVLLDDALETSLRSGPAATGRLHRVLASARTGASGGCDEPTGQAAPDPAAPAPAACRGEPVPLTFGVDPDLLATVEAMTQPYAVLQRGEPVVRPASDDAARWLQGVRTSAAAGAVLPLPFADPDVVALSRPESGVRDDVDLLRKLGQTEARRVLGVDALLTSVSWPPPGPIGGALDTLVGGGQGAVPPAIVVQDGAPVAVDPRGRTPGARTTLSSATGPVTALTVDEALSRLVEPDRSAPSWQGERLAEQRWIAEAAVLAAERPGQSRTFVVAPRRTADLLPGVAGPVIADSGRLPWLCPVSLASVAGGTERCSGLPDDQGPAPREDRVAAGLPDRTAPGLSPGFVEELAAVRRRSDQLTDEVLVAGSDPAKATKSRLLQARGRAASTAWRDAPEQGRRSLELLRAEVDGLREQVRLRSEPVLLTGSSGTMRLTVENALDQPVSIGVRLDDTSEARLSSRETDVREVPGRQAIQIAVQVDARTSGRFVARARLVDVNGDPFGEPVELAVRSTRYGRVALGVTGVALAVLLTAAGVRITRRARGRSATSRP